MALNVKHAFTSAKSDGTDSTLVQPSNWNANHVLTATAGTVLGAPTGSTTVGEQPLAFDASGQSMIPPSGTTAQRPATPAAGMVRYNTTFNKLEQYNGTSWGSVGGGATISDTAPSNPQAGDLWWKSDEGALYVYYNDGTSTQWVVANPFTGGGGYLPLSGGTLTGGLTVNGTISSVTSSSTNATFLDSYGTASTSNIALRKGRGTSSAPTAVQANDILGTYGARGYGTTGYLSTSTGLVRFYAAENFTDTAQGTYATIFTTANGTTGAVERMRIDDQGNVGVGTSSPTNKLHVIGGSVFLADKATNPTGYFNAYSYGSGTAGYTNYGAVGICVNPDGYGEGFYSYYSRGTDINTRALPNINDSLGQFGFQTWNGTTTKNVAGISAALTGTPSSTSLPTALVFLNTVTGATANAERMRLESSSGYLLVGYTTSNGAYRLQVNSQIFATSATIATSDARYKENVTPLNGALNLVQQLNPVQFSWKEHPIHNFDRAQPTVGFLAQEVREVLKDTPYVNSIVKGNTCTLEEAQYDQDGNLTKPAVTEEFLGIAEGNMIALLTKALQEANAKIDALTARVAALEAK